MKRQPREQSAKAKAQGAGPARRIAVFALGPRSVMIETPPGVEVLGASYDGQRMQRVEARPQRFYRKRRPRSMKGK